MRDTLADEEYFKEYIKGGTDTITEFNNKINEGKIRPERVEPIKEHLIFIKYKNIIAKYSSGYPIEEIKKDYLDYIKDEYERWDESNIYTYTLSVVSLGVLLNICKEHFSLMERKVSEIGMEDALMKFLFDYTLYDKVTNMEGEIIVKKPYTTLQELVANPNEREELLTRYIKKEWYRGHAFMDWYNSHKKMDKKLYKGYWSFEAGAVAKILKIDDSGLKNEKYYPYDLVHFTK